MSVGIRRNSDSRPAYENIEPVTILKRPSLRVTSGSARVSISLDDAIAAGSFQSTAQPCRLLHRRKGTDKNSIVDALCAEIHAANDWLAAAKQVRVFNLQRLERSLSIAFAALRRNLNHIAAAGNRRSFWRSAIGLAKCNGSGRSERLRLGVRCI